ncbi:MAG: DUF3084 domain-containing protein [Phascolarctobacterium sp.]|nr:DUF3084 domain-containing protein [Phascolarctobacterium sp.]
MVGIRMIVIMAIVGGLIAYIADNMGSKIGKKRMSVLGLRPKHTSILLTVLSGMMISVITIGVMAISSDSARTALFGMEKIRAELKSLNEEKGIAQDALARAKVEVEEKNRIISDLDEKIRESTRANDEMETKLADANTKYDIAQKEVADLTASRELLTSEVVALEESTAQLRQGIISMREGQVFYRAGEVVYAGIMRGGLSHDENVAQVNWLLDNANASVLNRLGIEEKDEKLQAIWLSKRIVDQAVSVLDRSKGNMFFRVRTIANIIVGEVVVCDIEMTDNQFIYPDNTLILSEKVDLKKLEGGYDAVIMNFLNKVNHKAVDAGVLPDPITGKVGNLDATTMIEASNDMRRIGGKVILKAFARGDITTAGPVRLRLEVVDDND